MPQQHCDRILMHTNHTVSSHSEAHSAMFEYCNLVHCRGATVTARSRGYACAMSLFSLASFGCARLLSCYLYLGAVGVIQASAMLDNGLRATPMMLQLPSNLKSPIVQKITVSWDGATPPTPPSAVTYDVVHLPAFSVDIRDNWYGTKYSAKKSTLVANITFTPTRVVLRPGAVNSKTILVSPSVALNGLLLRKISNVT